MSFLHYVFLESTDSTVLAIGRLSLVAALSFLLTTLALA